MTIRSLLDERDALRAELDRLTTLLYPLRIGAATEGEAMTEPTLQAMIEYLEGAAYNTDSPHAVHMLDAIADRLRAMQWRPMSEAPRDGTRFLAEWCRGGTFYQVHYYVAERHFCRTIDAEPDQVWFIAEDDMRRWMPIPPPEGGQ